MNRPVLIIPGWGEDAHLLHPTIELVKELGVDDIAFVADSDSLISDARSILEAWGRPAIVIAHSKGAIDAFIIAQCCPDLVSQLILACPAGLTRPSLLRLIFRFAIKCIASRPRQLVTAIRYTRLAPKRALWRDTKTIVNGTSTELIHEILGNDISVIVLASEKDRLFPLKEIQSWVNAAGLTELIRVVPVPGVHDAIHLKPDAYRRVLSQLLP